MKTTINLLTLCAVFFFASCSKVKDDIIEKLLTFDEAAQTIETFLNSTNCGLTEEIQNLAQTAYENYELYESNCDYGVDTSFNCGNDSGIRSWDYTLNYSWSVTCDDLNIPQSIEFISDKTGDFSGTRLTQTGDGNSNLQLTNLSPIPIGTNYVLNGTHNYSGSQELLIRNQSLTLTVEMDLTNAEITKTTFEIVNGSGSFTIVATGGSGISETVEGSIVFLGNGKAEVTINGETFMISI